MDERICYPFLGFFIFWNKLFASITVPSDDTVTQGTQLAMNRRFADSDFNVINSFIDVPFYDCKTECKKRPRCSAVDYIYRAKYCRLHTYIGQTVESQGSLIWNDLHDDVDNDSCRNQLCSRKDTYEKSSNSCIINECGYPELRMNIKGNIFDFGSKVIHNCSRSIETLTCTANGTWRDVDSSFTSQGITCRDMRLENVSLTSGVYINKLGIRIYCDFDRGDDNGGGDWMVFQRRMDGSVDFNRMWSEYKHGFGDVCGEYWLGLDNIKRILATQNKTFVLRIDLEKADGNTGFAIYKDFNIDPETDGYRLHIGNYSGTAGNALNSLYHPANGQRFSTRDTDNDNITTFNCANYFKGGWWYYRCTYVDLNGIYENMHWRNRYHHGRNTFGSVRKVSMKFREDDFN